LKPAVVFETANFEKVAANSVEFADLCDEQSAKTGPEDRESHGIV
jgi:hypothetical protein